MTEKKAIQDQMIKVTITVIGAFSQVNSLPMLFDPQ
jgi:hypothetical protein